MHGWSIWRKYGYLWVTLVLFLGSLAGHWTLSWFAYVEDQSALGQPVEILGYVVQTGRDTLENWQSEFLQLIWQVGGHAFLFHLGSPQSKEGDERKEEKLDAILRAIQGDRAERVIRELDLKFPRR